MSTTRDIRRCAVQALYQLDAQSDIERDRAGEVGGPGERGGAGGPLAKEALIEALEESPGDRETHKRGVDMALDAWAAREEADRAVAALSPDWPTHRQPVIDRCILRLGHFEIVSGRTPPKVAINEAVELAREYSTEKSPAFINGVLDKIMKATTKQRNVETSTEAQAE